MSAALETAITSMDFYRAVRLIDAAHPDLPRIGQAWTPAQECIRFGQQPELTFATSPLHSFEPETETTPPRLNINFLGLFGPNGPLPIHLTEFARDRLRHHHDPTLTAFLNIFNHRLTALFYRAWMVNQLALDLDRPGEQTFADYIGSLFGVGMEALHDTDSIPLNAKLYFTGRLSCQTRNAEGLESILREFFEIPSTLETHIGRWLPIPEENHLRLSGSRRTAAALGGTAVIGSKIWDTQLSFRIHMGPMDYADYTRMLPRGDSFHRLRDWIAAYAGTEFFWDVRLILKASQIPRTQLGAAGQRLGWTTWLHSNPPTRDAGDLIIAPADTRQL